MAWVQSIETGRWELTVEWLDMRRKNLFWKKERTTRLDLVNENKGGKDGRQSIKTNRKSRKCCRSNSIAYIYISAVVTEDRLIYQEPLNHYRRETGMTPAAARPSLICCWCRKVSKRLLAKQDNSISRLKKRSISIFSKCQMKTGNKKRIDRQD